MVLDLSVRKQTYVEDCEVCCNPIEITYTAPTGAASHPRTVVLVGANAQCTIVETYVGAEVQP